MKWQIVQGVTTTSHQEVVLQQAHHTSALAEVIKKKIEGWRVIYEIFSVPHLSGSFYLFEVC